MTLEDGARRFTRLIVMCSTLALPASLVLAQGRAQEGPAPKELAPLAFLLGEWQGGGGVPGQASGGTTFASALQGRVIFRDNWAVTPATGKSPASRHDDWMIVYVDDGGTVRADYWDNEGHVIRYAVVAEGPGRVTLVSDAAPAAPRYRLSYRAAANGVVKGTFEVAPPGRPEAFAQYLAWQMEKARKVK